MLLGFILLGRSLEERARLQASSDMNDFLSLVSSQSCLVVSIDGGNILTHEVLPSEVVCVEVPTDDIRSGDSILVLLGETIPVDGKVMTGTVNWEGPLRIDASTTRVISTISKIIHMVKEDQGQEAPI